MRARWSRIGLDTSILVYAFEMHRQFGALAKICMSRVETGVHSAVCSNLVLTELLPPYFARGEDRRAREIERRLASFPNLSLMPLSNDIAMEAARLRAVHGLRTPDAIHLATAMAAGAECFVTNDRGLAKLGTAAIAVALLPDYK